MDNSFDLDTILSRSHNDSDNRGNQAPLSDEEIIEINSELRF